MINRSLQCRILGGDSGSFFWVGGIGSGKRRRRDPWSSSYVHCMSRLQTAQIYVLMFCIICLILYK
jgi:hypothetical protein